MMANLLIRIFGWKATIFITDPPVFDRWRWLKRHLRAGSFRTLDAGCGRGVMAMYASIIGNEVVGIDNSGSAIEIAQNRSEILKLNKIRFLNVDLRNLNESAEKLGVFDQIICMETIEHIINDEKLIHDLSRLLKPRGRLFLTAPYKHYKPLRGDCISEVEDGGHVRWGYSHEEMKKIFKKCGVDTER